MKKLLKITLLILLCGMLMFGIFACDTPEEEDKYLEAYGRYYLMEYDFSSENGGSSLGITNLENWAIGKPQERVDFVMAIKAMVGDSIEFSKEGIQFYGEFDEFVPYERYSVSNHGTGFVIRFERNPSPFPEGKHLSGNSLRVISPSWSDTYYVIELKATIILGNDEEKKANVYTGPFLTFAMKFYKE